MSASELSSSPKPRRVLGEISMLLAAMIVLFPLYLIMITAVKSPNDIAMSPFGWPKGFVFNFTREELRHVQYCSTRYFLIENF